MVKTSFLYLKLETKKGRAMIFFNHYTPLSFE